jgi:hypothetical protein
MLFMDQAHQRLVEAPELRVSLHHRAGTLRRLIEVKDREEVDEIQAMVMGMAITLMKRIAQRKRVGEDWVTVSLNAD